MMLELKVRRTGNSIGLVLPKEAIAHLGVKEGDTLYVTFHPEGALRMSAADPEFAAKVQANEEFNRRYGNAVRELIRERT
jgi:putative addiction module antidote